MANYTFTFVTPGADLPADTPQTIGGCSVMHSFSVNAVPVAPGNPGYYVDDSATIRYTANGTAPTNTSPALGQ
jgi:hypothetical protein